MFDYNDASKQRDLELIPAGAVVTLQMNIRPGGAGEGGWLTRSKDGGCEMLDCEFTVVDGPHMKRKLWDYMVLAGTKDGHETAAKISRGKLRAILESAREIKPDDMSDAARKARNAELTDFNGICFVAKVGIEKGGPRNNGSGENYADRNVIAFIVTPDKKDWHAVKQAPPPPKESTATTTPAPITKPAWAKS